MYYSNTEPFVVSNIEEKHGAKIKQIAELLLGENLCDALSINRGVQAYLLAGNHKVSETVDEFYERRNQKRK